MTFDAQGQAEVDYGEPFFDSENDPVFEHAAMHRPGQKAFFISYEGWVYPATLNGMPARSASAGSSRATTPKPRAGARAGGRTPPITRRATACSS